MIETSIISHLSFNPSWKREKFRWIFENRKVSTSEIVPILGANIHVGVTERFEGDGRPAASDDLSKYKLVEPGDIIMNPLGKPHGSIGMSAKRGITSPAYWVLRLDPTENDSRFFHYLLRSEFLIREYVRLSKNLPPNQFDLQWDQFREIELPIPPIEEQRRIADYLGGEIKRIDSLIDAKNKQIMLYMSALDSKKNQIVWEDNNERLIPLGYLVRCNQRSLGNETDPDFRFAYCDVGSVNFRTGISVEIESFSFAEAPSRARRLAQAGDVVFSMVRPYLRAVAKVPKFERQLVFSTAFAVLEPVEISADYLFEVLTTTKFLSETESWSTGMSYPAINQETLLKIKVPYLDSGMQHKKISDLSEQLASTIQLIEKVEQSIRALAEYKTAVIAAAVSGNHSTIAGRNRDS